MQSKYLLQIVDTRTGEVVKSWAPGLAAEKLLIEELSNRLVAKGVGVFKTSAQVKAAFVSAFEEMLKDLKKQV